MVATTSNNKKKTKSPASTAIVPAAQSPPADFTTREVALACASSGFFADSRDAHQALVKMAAARELGLGNIAGMTGVYIVKGRVTLSANLMAAAIQKSGTHRYRVLKHTAKGCEIEFQERDADTKKWEAVGVSSFDENDAKAAGLLGGDNWRKYPRNMYFARAMSNGAKWYTPSVFAGSPPYTPDELGVDAEMTEDGDFIVVEVEPSETKDALHDLCLQVGSDPAKVASHYKKKTLGQLTPEERKNAESLLRAKLEV